MQIKPIDPINRPFFAGEVSGADWRKVPSPAEAEAIHRGMDEFGVLVFRDQDVNDEQLLRYSRHILLDEIGIEAQSDASLAGYLEEPGGTMAGQIDEAIDAETALRHMIEHDRHERLHAGHA